MRSDGERHGPWRVVGDGRQAWFRAPSLAAGAQLVERLTVGNLAGPRAIDLRDSGVRVRLAAGDMDIATSVSTWATDLGLTAEPAVLQDVRVAIDTADVPRVAEFWQAVLGYPGSADGRLGDPLRHSPDFVIRPGRPPGEQRYRMHVDVVRVSSAVMAARSAVAQEPHGPFGLALTDPDGTEVDVVPGDPLPGGPTTSDWRALFGAMTFYPTASPAESSRLVSAIARVADAAGVPLLIGVRPEGVVLDSGKDQWADEEFGREPRFAELAAAIQEIASGQGRTADPDRLQFVQLCLDAVDVPAVRSFWAAALGYESDPRDGLTDLVDPRGLNPVLMFQPMDDDAERLAQRDRLRLEVSVPADLVSIRVATAVEAGGRLVDDASGRWVVADPEGNELVFVT